MRSARSDVIGALGELMVAYPASEDARESRVKRSLSGIDHGNRAAAIWRQSIADPRINAVPVCRGR